MINLQKVEIKDNNQTITVDGQPCSRACLNHLSRAQKCYLLCTDDRTVKALPLTFDFETANIKQISMSHVQVDDSFEFSIHILALIANLYGYALELNHDKTISAFNIKEIEKQQTPESVNVVLDAAA